MTPCITNLGKASKHTNGYATIYDPNKKRKVRTHRYMFEQAFGTIPVGLVIMHICDNRACSNLQHLKLATQSENITDMYKKGRQGDRATKQGESHHMTKVTQEDVDNFRSTPYYRGLYFRWAKLHGVSRPTARNIYIGKTWPNYTPPNLEGLIPDDVPGFEYYERAAN